MPNPQKNNKNKLSMEQQFKLAHLINVYQNRVNAVNQAPDPVAHHDPFDTPLPSENAENPNMTQEQNATNDQTNTHKRKSDTQTPGNFCFSFTIKGHKLVFKYNQQMDRYENQVPLRRLDESTSKASELNLKRHYLNPGFEPCSEDTLCFSNQDFEIIYQEEPNFFSQISFCAEDGLQFSSVESSADSVIKPPKKLKLGLTGAWYLTLNDEETEYRHPVTAYEKEITKRNMYCALSNVGVTENPFEYGADEKGNQYIKLTVDKYKELLRIYGRDPRFTKTLRPDVVGLVSTNKNELSEFIKLNADIPGLEHLKNFHLLANNQNNTNNQTNTFEVPQFLNIAHRPAPKRRTT